MYGVVAVACAECRIIGQHQGDCVLRKLLPSRLLYDAETGFVSEGMFDGGRKVPNTSTRKLVFKNTGEVFLQVGRELHKHSNGDLTWKRMRDEREVDILKTPRFIDLALSFARNHAGEGGKSVPDPDPQETGPGTEDTAPAENTVPDPTSTEKPPRDAGPPPPPTRTDATDMGRATLALTKSLDAFRQDNAKMMTSVLSALQSVSAATAQLLQERRQPPPAEPEPAVQENSHTRSVSWNDPQYHIPPSGVCSAERGRSPRRRQNRWNDREDHTPLRSSTPRAPFQPRFRRSESPERRNRRSASPLVPRRGFADASPDREQHTGMNSTLASASKTALMKNLIDRTPTFKGIQDQEEFPSWLSQIDAFMDMNLDEQEGKDFILTKVTKDAFEVVTALRHEPWSVIRARLVKDYDPLGGEVGSYQAWHALRQGNEKLVAHNAKVYRIFRETRRSTLEQNPEWNITYVESLANFGQRKKLSGWVHDHSLEEIMDEARKMDRQHEFASRGEAEAGFAQVAAYAPRDRRDSRNAGPPAPRTPNRWQNNRTADFNSPGKGEAKWCAIHDAASHTSAECTAKNSNYCQFCQEEVTAGTLVKHSETCTARRCWKCNRRGHVASECGNEDRRRGAPANNRTPDPKKARVAATTEDATAETEAEDQGETAEQPSQ